MFTVSQSQLALLSCCQHTGHHRSCALSVGHNPESYTGDNTLVITGVEPSQMLLTFSLLSWYQHTCHHGSCTQLVGYGQDCCTGFSTPVIAGVVHCQSDRTCSAILVSTHLLSQDLYTFSWSQTRVLHWYQHTCHHGNCTQLFTRKTNLINFLLLLFKQRCGVFCLSSGMASIVPHPNSSSSPPSPPPNTHIIAFTPTYQLICRPAALWTH